MPFFLSHAIFLTHATHDKILWTHATHAKILTQATHITHAKIWPTPPTILRHQQTHAI